MTNAWKTKAARHVIVVVITPPISGPMAAPTPPMALITPNACARDLGPEQHGGEDVDGRDQQGGTNALEDGVAQDQYAEAG